MNLLPVFSDVQLADRELDLLKSGVAPGELIQAANSVVSPMVKIAADPAFEKAVLAFGQPDLASIYAAPDLRWIQVSSAGFTRYDTPEFRDFAKGRGLIVTNSSSVYAEACAEHVFAFLLANQRQLPVSLKTKVASADPAWTGLRSQCRLLKNQNILILGYGAIAARLVEILRPFEVEIVAMRRQPRGDEGIPVVTPENLPCALAKADHVINILPDNVASNRFFNADRFAQMETGAVFYNIGRGTTVDQSDLYDALISKKLSAAWLDVTDPEPLPEDHPLWTLGNCYITPHIAGGYATESEDLVKHFLENLDRFSRGEILKDRVI